MGLYRGWQCGGVGALCPQFSLDPRMHEDYAFVYVCLLNLSVCLSVCLSISLYVYLSLSICICMSVCMSRSQHM